MIIITWIIAGIIVEKVEAIYILTIALAFSIKSEIRNTAVYLLPEWGEKEKIQAHKTETNNSYALYKASCVNHTSYKMYYKILLTYKIK